MTDQFNGLVVEAGGNGEDLGGRVEAQRARRVHQVHDGLQRLGIGLS